MCCKVLVAISLILGVIGAGLGIWNTIEMRGYSMDTFACDICIDISSTTGIIPYDYCSDVCDIDLSCELCQVTGDTCKCIDPSNCYEPYCNNACVPNSLNECEDS